ncbi:LacI family DNA-binding transcriptional regulator [Klebsiella pneumoniae subsp. pneumoniae]|nr:LacI family DNA-binding transcriptional regulator [Klebsiella pneumoniae subsp. pneumoniae]
MKDVARIAGVSTSTVSHVINKDRFVSEAITAKVDAAIKASTTPPLRWRVASSSIKPVPSAC